MAASIGRISGYFLRPLLFKHRINLTRAASLIPSEEVKSPPEEKWKLYGSVCIERYPCITAEKTELEKKYENLLIQLEYENSVLSTHEVQHRNDIKMAEKKKLGEDDGDEVQVQTRLDLEDIWDHERQKFQPASRTTDADKKDNMKSTARKLDQSLILLVKQKIGSENIWVLPQCIMKNEASMRKVAENALKSNCGDNILATFMGNAPCGFYKYKFRENIDDPVGVKIFFFKAHYVSGNVELANESSDYVWVTKEELKDYLVPAYLNSVKKFLLHS